MTLLEVKRLFVELSGRYDLVQDTTSYKDASPLGATWFLNLGAKLLDRLALDDRRVQQTYMVDVVKGTTLVNVPRGVALLNVFLVDADGKWLDVHRTTPERIFLERRQPTSPAVPRLWAPYHTQLAPTQATLSDGLSILTNGDFSSGSTGWTVGTAWTISGGVASVLTATTTSDLSQVGVVKGGTSYKLRFTVLNYVSGYLTPRLSDVSGASVSGNGTYEVTLSPNVDGDLVFEAATSTELELDDVSLVPQPVYTEQFSYGLNVVQLGDRHDEDAVLLFPEPDKTYTLAVKGVFRARELSHDNDTNVWTVIAPELLVKAAMYHLETTYRNSEGQRDLLEAIRFEVQGLVSETYLEQANMSTVIGG